MWTTVLEWVRTLVGTLVGVVIGARLTGRAQDRQFARQRAAQRVDQARTAYQDAEVISAKLIHALNPHKTHQLVGPGALGRVADVPALSADLMGVAVKLRSDGASDVALSFDHLWNTAQSMYDRVAGHATVMAMGEGGKATEFDWHMDKREQLSLARDQARAYWVDWLRRQESLSAKRRRNWRLWRNRVATVQIRLGPSDPPEVTIKDQPIG